MRQLTVDVNVLIYGSVSGTENHDECNSLMRCLEQSDRCGIVLDRDDRIYAQYKHHLAGKPYGLKWLRTMIDSGKTVYLPRANIPSSKRVKLSEIGFVGEDYDYYVRTCASSCCRVITSHDSDFSRARWVLKKQLDIRIQHASGAEEFARNGPCRSCDVTPVKSSPI